jgi:hypothetical protein
VRDGFVAIGLRQVNVRRLSAHGDLRRQAKKAPEAGHEIFTAGRVAVGFDERIEARGNSGDDANSEALR